MRNDNVIPRVAILMAKDDKVSWIGVFRVRRFEPVTQLNGFAQSGLGEMDMVNVRAFAGSGGRGGGLFSLPRALVSEPERMEQATG